MSGHHKSTRADNDVRREYKAKCAETNFPCCICQQAFDYAARKDDYADDDRFQRDYFFPASTHHLYDDPANWRPSHAGCNRDRSDEDARAGIGTASRLWLG